VQQLTMHAYPISQTHRPTTPPPTCDVCEYFQVINVETSTSVICTGVYPHMSRSHQPVYHKWFATVQPVCHTWLMTVRCIIDFSLFGVGVTPGPKFTEKGDDLLPTQVYHPAKF